MSSSPLRIGTRRSKLALTQSGLVADELRSLGYEVEMVEIVTAGDRGVAPEPGQAEGLKGLFVAEIVKALQAGEVDLAIHSAKDLPAEDPDGIVIAAVPRRASPFDLLLSREASLPAGAKVGSSSLRRRAQLAAARPELDAVEMRGNVDTRLAKMREGIVDGLVLAAAGLARLGIRPEHATELTPDEMVPAPGQGSLAVHARDGSAAAHAAGRIDDTASHRSLDAERTVVRRLGGGCYLPLGAYAETSPDDDAIRLRAIVLAADGTEPVRAEAEGSDPVAVADEVSDRLLEGGAARILEAVR
jgi:hydroxymethylbilane synthase